MDTKYLHSYVFKYFSLEDNTVISKQNPEM